MARFISCHRKLPAAQLSLLLLLGGLLCSCASYHRRMENYHQHLAAGNYAKANRQLDHVKLLQKKRNELLYLLEKGRVLHLMQAYDSSNAALNAADVLLEQRSRTGADVAATLLLNPMVQAYQPEPYERFLVHYYKALNYLAQRNTEAALVEARRITLASNALADRAAPGNRYRADAFAQYFQGMLFEKGGDINNAFIAYRNAASQFNASNNWYGVPLPQQLQTDVLRTARIMGFETEWSRFQREWNLSAPADTLPAGGELVLIWENGQIPVKDQQMLGFDLVPGVPGNWWFADRQGLYRLPFNTSIAGFNAAQSAQLRHVGFFTVALPRYREQPVVHQSASASLNGKNYPLQPVLQLNQLAPAILRERLGNELATALSRLALKKLAELALTPTGTPNYSGKTAAEREKAERRRNQQEWLALGLKVFNRVTEQADTRHWQSLPAQVFMARIPLQPGVNRLVLRITGSSGPKEKIIEVEGKGQLLFYPVYTL